MTKNCDWCGTDVSDGRPCPQCGSQEWMRINDCGMAVACTHPGIYFCPTSGEDECPGCGGFDVCCGAPQLHRPVLRPPDADPLGYRPTTPAEIDNAVRPGAWKDRS